MANQAVKKFAFSFLPSLVGLVIGIMFTCSDKVSLESSIVSGFGVGGIFTFGITASILLISMPRGNNQYLKDLDKEISPYIRSIAIPSLWSALAAVSQGIKIQGNSVLQSISILSFWASITTFAFSIWVLNRIIKRANQSGVI